MPRVRSFVSPIERLAEREGIDPVAFERGERKNELTRKYLRQWPAGEGILDIGEAQEKVGRGRAVWPDNRSHRRLHQH